MDRLSAKAFLIKALGRLRRRREATSPYSSVGADSAAADFFEAFAMSVSVTLPFRVAGSTGRRTKAVEGGTAALGGLE